MEIVRQKNVATYIVAPIVDADGDLVTGASSLDSEIDAWTDGAAPDGFADCTNEATEIGSTGLYYLSLTQTEMNNDYIVIQIKTGTAGAKTQVILIRTMVGDPLNIATSDDGGAFNVASGVIEANAVQLSGDSVAADNSEAFFDGTGYAGTNNVIPTVTTVNGLAANTITAASIATNAIGASELASDAANEIADALLDRTDGVETSYTLRQALRLILSASAAKLSGAATTTVAIRDVGDTKDRITATVDADGNRTAITLDAT